MNAAAVRLSEAGRGTAISVEECITQEQIVERLRLHKEVLSSVKQQPWGMRRKLRLVKQAKAYVKQHEGELRERRTTRHLLSRCHLLVIKRWQHTRRELDNLMNALIPWELRIKQIESHFGSVVASYFTFLRWLFWVNLVITVLLVAFVAIPEMLTADTRTAGERKEMLPRERRTATNLDTLWDFDGVLKYSPIFYGYYTNRDAADTGYRLPFAYFMTGIAVYAYSFVATLRKMAENSRMSKLSEKDDECVFTWKLFTGWDYMIGNAETAHNRVASIVLGFKEALLEEAERRRDARNWRVLCLRALVNLAVLVLLASSAYAVVEVVKRSNQTSPSDSWWRQNEITVVMSLIQYVYPILFEVLGLLESYHPRKQLRIQLARIMALNMLSLYTLIIALFDKIKDMRMP
ncbi:transmembrane channel-like protein [Schistocerca cancellata]|uniref:transmembrane channel-like protein n=1 Tax=Schistocerca cancellata TaxID=274614 RepID=UPI002118CC8A|nr:transmembrane channel-like protein [Schistocerca cancellata]